MVYIYNYHLSSHYHVAWLLYHLTLFCFPALAEPLTATDIPEDEESRLGSEPSTPKGDQDLLTCGQCHSRFPLADILLFIEHKRRLCQGRLCMDKDSDEPPSPPRQAPVEVAVQVSPHAGERLVSTPHGLRPKQETVTGRVTDVYVGAHKLWSSGNFWLNARISHFSCAPFLRLIAQGFQPTDLGLADVTTFSAVWWTCFTITGKAWH